MPGANAKTNVDGVERVPLRIQLEELDAPVSGKAGQTVIYLLGSVKDLSKRKAARRKEDGPERQELCLGQAPDGGKGRSVKTMSGVNFCRRTTASAVHASVCSAENPYRMSFPMSVTRARVGTVERDSKVAPQPDCRMPGSVRTTNLLWAP